MSGFKLKAPFSPRGDQPEAIAKLVQSIRSGNDYQTLWGVTGSGKTYTMANVIQKLQVPTLVICHNKTLAAQLYSEFQGFFPDNAVEYFVSYYDYYQPEAYIPKTDTYIEKDSSINQEIDRLRISTSSSLLNRTDVIVVASVSCIYGLGSPDDFEALVVTIKKGEEYGRGRLLEELVRTQYNRNDRDFQRGCFRLQGETVDVFPADSQNFVRVSFWGDELESIYEYDGETGDFVREYDEFRIYPANQYITSPGKLQRAMQAIEVELAERIAWLEQEDLLVEAQRLKMRTDYDLQMLREMGFCSGIENYSRHIGGRKEGSRPWCLLDFFPDGYLTIVDESHVTIPQVRGMYHGDRARKQRLIDHGFRLPSALDNRPLKPDEFEFVSNQVLYVSATPSRVEMEQSSVIAEQIIRPTGLLDPVMEVRPIKGQVEDLMGEIRVTVEQGDRILVTTLTKRMSEDLSDYLQDAGVRVEYLHSDINALERVEILRRLREGRFDVLIGVNLLREGLDLPEVALVAILDADKEGFLRSETSIIQTAGRAARHEKGRVLLYADVMTKSLTGALEVTQGRRERQIAFNKEHGITPRSVKRKSQKSLSSDESGSVVDPVSMKETGKGASHAQILGMLQGEMVEAAERLDFEKAAALRDQINYLKEKL